ncbi:MAG: nicotinate (nicotinamide) nucleotide adenylyltransferase [Ruminococcus sp.]|nr:nicotinate (nicotinamide) nucleotide adenylyltransferase [Candidatus Apopatosoma intestinale]
MKIGLYGGSFDPPHRGHLSAARHFVCALHLDRLIVMPTSLSPAKSGRDGASPQDRLAMTRLAFADFAACPVTVSDDEIRRGGKSYTLETLKRLSDGGVEHPYLLCGTDMLLSFDRWLGAKEILAMATPVVMPRAEEDRDVLRRQIAFLSERYGGEIVPLDGTPVPLSSTEVRAKIRAGIPTGDDLPDAVSSYAKEKGLYR